MINHISISTALNSRYNPSKTLTIGEDATKIAEFLDCESSIKLLEETYGLIIVSDDINPALLYKCLKDEGVLFKTNDNLLEEYAKAGFYLIHIDDSGCTYRKRRARISLGMIVKNEENNIEKAIKSTKNKIDEIIIVDTGNIDKTNQIAESLGAKIIKSSQYNDDPKECIEHFGNAKNEFIDAATGDWILWMDADDEWCNIEKLEVSPFVDYYNVLLNYGKSNFYSVRLFRNNWNIKFIGAIHEVPWPTPNLRRAEAEFSVKHDTKEKPGRLERNLKILLKEYEKKPKDSRNLFYLGNTYREMGKYDDAIKIYHERLDCIDKNKDWVAERYLAAYYAAYCYACKGQWAECYPDAIKAIEITDMYAEAYELIGEMYYNLGNYAKAIDFLNLAYHTPKPKDYVFIREEMYDEAPLEWIKRCRLKIKQHLNI